MSNLDFDYLSAEPAIIARLRAAVPELREVRSELELSSLPDGLLLDPGAVIIYGGERIQANDTNGATQSVQTWIVGLAVREPNDFAGDRKRSVAGPLISKINNALVGFEPTPRHFPLTRVTGPRPQVHGQGLLVFPITFETSIFLAN